MWALKGFFLSHTNSWRCFFNFEDAQKASLWSCFEPCLRPDQTWETTRFREVECQGLTQESCMGSSAEKEPDSQDSFPGSVQLRLGRHASLCLWESQAGNQSPELCKMLWSCEWRGIPLLSGTFLFAVIRPYLNHKHFWVDELEFIRVPISLSSLQSQAGGKVGDGSAQILLSFQHGRDS